MLKRIIIILLSASFLTSCANKGEISPSFHYKNYPNCTYFSESKNCETSSKRKVSIFFDGTGNNEKSNTNVAKLYNKITLQDKKNIHSLYIAGVGTELSKIITGNIFGRGFDERVKWAYYYIASNYRQELGDELYLFGFSRGSYSARVLAGLIYVADLPNLDKIKDEKSKKKLIDKIFEEYKSKTSIDNKRKNIQKIDGYIKNSKGTRITYMGIFDTVSALSYDPREGDDIEFLSEEYEDQICNIDQVSHAMSIDDNRVHSFTPVPMKVKAIASMCKGMDSDEEIGELIDSVISEVWFSGAHSDVGGGYNDSELSGVPLNWMMRQIKKSAKIADLLPDNPYVYEDIFGNSHIGEDSIISGKIYINRNRNIPAYMNDYHEGFRIPVIHSSVIKRREKLPRTCREFDFNPSGKITNCYNEAFTPPKNYQRCFESKKVVDSNIPNRIKKSNFILKYIPNKEDPCFIIDEPELL